jgi:hypothetical protein
MVVEHFSPSPVALLAIVAVGFGGVSSPPLAGLGNRGLCSLPVLSSPPSLVVALLIMLTSMLWWAVLCLGFSRMPESDLELGELLAQLEPLGLEDEVLLALLDQVLLSSLQLQQWFEQVHRRGSMGLLVLGLVLVISPRPVLRTGRVARRHRGM